MLESNNEIIIIMICDFVLPFNADCIVKLDFGHWVVVECVVSI